MLIQNQNETAFLSSLPIPATCHRMLPPRKRQSPCNATRPSGFLAIRSLVQHFMDRLLTDIQLDEDLSYRLQIPPNQPISPWQHNQATALTTNNFHSHSNPLQTPTMT